MTRKKTTQRTPATGKVKTQSRKTKASRHTVPTPKKVYKNDAGKVIYRQSTDKVGDVLVNQAGVKYKIAGERFVPPTGAPGDVLIRVLKLKPQGGYKADFAVPSIEMNDQVVKQCRDSKIFRRERPEAAKKKPTTSPTYTVWDSKRGKTFATVGEASAYAEEHRRKTGEILTITQTKRKATHEYGKRGRK